MTLAWFANMTRVGIAQPINRLAQYMNRPQLTPTEINQPVAVCARGVEVLASEIMGGGTTRERIVERVESIDVN